MFCSPEIRRPKAEIRKKAEGRSPKTEAERGSVFGLRISGLQNMIFPQLAGLQSSPGTHEENEPPPCTAQRRRPVL